jgi:hypothetical protein
MTSPPRGSIETTPWNKFLVDQLVKEFLGEISGSHGGEYDEGCLLGCAVYLVEAYRRFRGICCFHRKHL